jgi:hypothetical protein
MKSWKKERKKNKNEQRSKLDLQTSLDFKLPLNLTKLTFVAEPCRFKKFKNLVDGG